MGRDSRIPPEQMGQAAGRQVDGPGHFPDGQLLQGGGCFHVGGRLQYPRILRRGTLLLQSEQPLGFGSGGGRIRLRAHIPPPLPYLGGNRRIQCPPGSAPQKGVLHTAAHRRQLVDEHHQSRGLAQNRVGDIRADSDARRLHGYAIHQGGEGPLHGKHQMGGEMPVLRRRGIACLDVVAVTDTENKGFVHQELTPFLA